MGSSNWVHFGCKKILKETDSVFLLRLENGEEIWIPFSQIDYSDEYKEGDKNCSIGITPWIAKQKGFDCD